MEELLGISWVRMEEDVCIHPAWRAKVIAGVRRRLVDVLGVVEHKVGVDACEMSLVTGTVRVVQRGDVGDGWEETKQR